MTYIEWPNVTFGGITFEGDGHGLGGGSYRTLHRIVIETCGANRGLVAGSEFKDAGITRLIRPIIPGLPTTGKATGATLKALVTKTPTGVGVAMSGDETNPLTPGGPGITYNISIDFNTKTGRATFSGNHDGFPSYEFWTRQKLVRHWSHVQGQTSPKALLPPAELPFLGGFSIEKGNP